jgi:hypothetical protein
MADLTFLGRVHLLALVDAGRVLSRGGSGEGEDKDGAEDSSHVGSL